MKILLSTIVACTLCVGCSDKDVAPDEDPKPTLTQEWPETVERAEEVKSPPPEEVEPQPEAVAQITGPGVTGVVRIYRAEKGVLMEGKIEGLSLGEHAIHIHEKGQCDSPDFESAGGHYNPTGKAHGAPYEAVHHAGDLGNLTTNENGTADFRFEDPELSLDPDSQLAIVGKAFIIHEGADDLESQPSGAAGKRVACGVIEKRDGDST